jgi:antitoxin (DNA-binding transcriptional repressor) of toxin-antitoxin stability system
MTTLTVTEARKNLSGWLRRATAGEEIGIIDGNKIIALRPVTVTAVDFEEIPTDAGTQKKMDSIGETWKRVKK